MTIQKSRDLTVPVLAVLGLMAITAALVIGVVIGNLLPTTFASAADSLSGWIASLATSIICVLTIVLAIETWRLRKAQAKQLEEFMLDSIRPNVSVELIGSHVGMNFMNVRVHNSGKGIARNITFEFLDRNNQPVGVNDAPIVGVFHNLAMFRLGINSLGINQELKSYIFSFLDITDELGVDVFSHYLNIRVRFEDTKGRELFNEFVIDFAQYEGFSEIGGDSLSLLADEVQKLRKEFHGVITWDKRLAVNVHSAADRAAEQTALLNRRTQQRHLQEARSSKRKPNEGSQI